MPGQNKNSNSTVMAIDWGSQSARCAIFSRSGERLSLATIHFSEVEQGVQHDASQPESSASACRNLLWHLIRTCIESCVESTEIAAIAICAQRSGLVALSYAEEKHEQSSTPLPINKATSQTAAVIEHALAPIGPGLCWHNGLDAPQMAPPWWVRSGASLVGQRARLTELLARAPSNRLHHHNHNSWRQSAYFLPWSAYLSWCLNGKTNDGITGATGIYPFNFRRSGWHDYRHWTWAALHCQGRNFPRLFAAGEVLGLVHTQAASACGLKTGIPVIACGADKAAEALGAGAVNAGDWHLSLGTAVSLSRVQTTKVAWNFLQPAFPSLLSGLSLRERQLEQGLAVVRHFLQLLSQQTAANEKILDYYLKQAGSSRGTLLCYPQHYPENNEAWLGELLHHEEPQRVYSALMRGLAFRLAEAMNSLQSPWTLASKQAIYVSGGGAQSTALVQLIAAVLQRPLCVALDPECGLRGAAMCAAVGAGWYANLEQTHAFCSTHYLLQGARFAQQAYTQHYQQDWRPYARHGRAWVHLGIQRG